MLKVIKIDQKNEWDSAISQFNNRDIYLDRAYFNSLAKYQGSEINLLYYENADAKICEVVQINDIESCKHFKGLIEQNKYFDIETPYGYGGLTFENATEKDFEDYYSQKSKWAVENGIISEFVRFNPLLENFKIADKKSKVINVKSTVFIELRPEDELMLELHSKNRNMVRKAQKNGIDIICVEPLENKQEADNFVDLYIKTMQRNNAEEFYFFNKEYFNTFFEDMKGKCKLFCAKFEGKTIASAIMIFNNKNIHYYLSGADRDYMNMAPNNLLLFRAGVWANENGFERFHLGGGVSDNDALFSFKKQFNEKGILPFYIGRTIFDNEKFDYLVQLRKNNDENFDMEKPFLIKYRQE